MKFTTKILLATDFLINKLHSFSAIRYSTFYAALILSIIALLLCYPKYETLDLKMKEVVPQGLKQQFNNPFSQIDFNLIENKDKHEGQVSHLDKRAFRITVPIIGRIAGFNVIGAIILQHTTTFLLIFLIINYFKKKFNPTTGLIVGLFFTGIITVQWGFYDFFFYDGIAWFLIFLSLANPFRLINFLILLLAYFTDERALICSSILFLFYLNDSHQYRISSTIILVLSWIAYLAIRLFLSNKFGLNTGTTLISFEIFKSNLHILPLAILSTYEMGAFIILFTLILLIQERQYFTIFIFISSLTITVGAAIFVLDLTRGIGYSFMGLVFCLFVFLKEEKTNYANRVILIMGILNLAFPNYYFMMGHPYLQMPFIRLFTE